MAREETLQAFARELHELEQKYSLRILNVYLYNGNREMKILDQDDMDFYYVNKAE